MAKTKAVKHNAVKISTGIQSLMSGPAYAEIDLTKISKRSMTALNARLANRTAGDGTSIAVTVCQSILETYKVPVISSFNWYRLDPVLDAAIFEKLNAAFFAYDALTPVSSRKWDILRRKNLKETIQYRLEYGAFYDIARFVHANELKPLMHKTPEYDALVEGIRTGTVTKVRVQLTHLSRK